MAIHCHTSVKSCIWCIWV